MGREALLLPARARITLRRPFAFSGPNRSAGRASEVGLWTLGDWTLHDTR